MTLTMQAVIQHAYGPPESVLSVEHVEKPVPKDDEVLVRVRAASMHPDVWHVIVGYPFVMRLMGNGVRQPKRRIPGTDLAGVVESVGKRVTRFKAGDEVFGESASFGWLNGGAYAEFAAVPEDFLALKPKNVTFEQAAAVPTAGMIALQNLGGAKRPARRNSSSTAPADAWAHSLFRSPRPTARTSPRSTAQTNCRCSDRWARTM
jgi:NADPH:quinone reductase-like Zn-dependent oxidoreductase